VFTNTGKVKLIETSMSRGEYLFKIERALEMALAESAETNDRINLKTTREVLKA
jgi:hypothetical protein